MNNSRNSDINSDLNSVLNDISIILKVVSKETQVNFWVKVYQITKQLIAYKDSSIVKYSKMVKRMVNKYSSIFDQIDDNYNTLERLARLANEKFLLVARYKLEKISSTKKLKLTNDSLNNSIQSLSTIKAKHSEGSLNNSFQTLNQSLAYPSLNTQTKEMMSKIN